MKILDFIFPKRCVGCGSLGRYICDRCKKQIIPIAPNECVCPVCGRPAIAGITHPRCRSRYGLDGLTSFFYYKDAVRQAIQTIKYRYVSDAAAEFIGLIPLSAYEIYSVAGSPDVLLMPVPLHISRYRHRGFNQSEVLGRLVASALNIPMVNTALIRLHATDAQVKQKDRAGRLANIHNAFSGNASVIDGLKQNTVLLFDDVFTTGATLRDAASALKHGGIKQVWGVTMAR